MILYQSFPDPVSWILRTETGPQPAATDILRTVHFHDVIGIARLWTDGRWLPGKYFYGEFFSVTDESTELIDHDSDLEVMLKIDVQYRWATYSGSLPSGAVVGGTTKDGDPLYVARALCGSDHRNGAYFNLKKTYASLQCSGVVNATSFQLLDIQG